METKNYLAKINQNHFIYGKLEEISNVTYMFKSGVVMHAQSNHYDINPFSIISSIGEEKGLTKIVKVISSIQWTLLTYFITGHKLILSINRPGVVMRYQTGSKPYR